MTSVTRLFDFPYYQLAKNPLQKSLITKKDGTWQATSTQEYIDKANAISRGLLRMGVKPNDKIAIIFGLSEIVMSNKFFGKEKIA